jgi:hypothetical protein
VGNIPGICVTNPAGPRIYMWAGTSDTKPERTMNLTKTINVTRTNYDRFVSESGMVYTSAMLTTMRKCGTTIVVTDKTPAEQGRWVLEPLGN